MSAADKAKNWSHLGDGVYVGFDGHGFWLHANAHDYPTDAIYLEPEVFEGLVRYVKETKAR